MNPKQHIPAPPPLELALFLAALMTLVLFLPSCSSVTSAGPLAFMSNQSANRIETRKYENGTLVSEVVVEGYNTVNPNPEVTEAAKNIAGLYIGAKGAVELAEVTVVNPNKVPKNPNKIPQDPNKIPKNPNVIPKDPNHIPVDPNIKP